MSSAALTRCGTNHRILPAAFDLYMGRHCRYGCPGLPLDVAIVCCLHGSSAVAELKQEDPYALHPSSSTLSVSTARLPWPNLSRRTPMPFTLPALPYPADALEAAIDKTTMEIHHGRHHKAYVDNLNAALSGHAALEAKPLEQLLREIQSVPEAVRQKVVNNGGGHANHSLFWEIMGPK